MTVAFSHPTRQDVLLLWTTEGIKVEGEKEGPNIHADPYYRLLWSPDSFAGKSFEVWWLEAVPAYEEFVKPGLRKEQDPDQ